MIKMTVNLLGVKSSIASMEAANRRMGKRFEKGALKAGEFVKKESQHFVPYDTGALHDSAYVENVGGKGWRASIAVGYDISYAIYVHERLDLKHLSPTKAKFLEDVIRQKQAKIQAIVRKAIVFGV